MKGVLCLGEALIDFIPLDSDNIPFKRLRAGHRLMFRLESRSLEGRPPLLAKAEIMAALPYADIVKISEEELTFLTGCSDMEEGISRLPENKLTIVTLGR